MVVAPASLCLGPSGKDVEWYSRTLSRRGAAFVVTGNLERIKPRVIYSGLVSSLASAQNVHHVRRARDPPRTLSHFGKVTLRRKQKSIHASVDPHTSPASGSSPSNRGDPVKMFTDEQSGAATPALDREKLLATLQNARLAICITDPSQTDNPIVFVNAAFCALTGYSAEEILGRNCRFLQGEGTTPESLAEIREVIASRRVDTVEIINYRKDGTPFLNSLQIGPIPGEDGEAILFFGSQLDVSQKRESERRMKTLTDQEIEHRLRNIVNVMSVVIRQSVRDESDAQKLARQIESRLKALSDAHFQAFRGDRENAMQFEELAAPILRAYAPNGEVQFQIAGSDPSVPVSAISPLTLAIHELATNSVKHGALGCDEGRVIIDASTDGGISMRWEERGGPRVVIPKRRSGSNIIRRLVEAAGGSLDLHWHPDGLVVEAFLPA